MSLIALGAHPGILAAAEGESHFPPSPSDFWQPMWYFGHIGDMTLAITRPMVVLVIVFLLLTSWLLWSTRKAAIVPGKAQWLTEGLYGFVRNNIAQDMIGTKHFMRFVPLLFALFMFILVSNLMAVTPGVQMPPTARIGIPIALTLFVYCVYHWVGIKQNGGIGGYLKHMVPPDVPGWLKPALFVLEIITYFITRPLTLAMRLFGNMFAGHLLLVVFIVGGWELFQAGGLMSVAAIPAWIMGIVFTGFEMLIQFLQAFVFTLLAASYIAGALAEEH